MIVLAMDTSTRAGSVAVVGEGELIAEYNLNIAETHTSRLMPMIDQVLKDAHLTITEMDAIAVGLGPGSFTGLRIGLATAKGLALALNKPIVGIPTLDALAHNLSSTPNLICPVLDAKRGEIYAALYRYSSSAGRQNLKKLTKDLVLPMRELLDRINEPVTFLGDAILTYQDVIKKELGKKASFAPPYLCLPRAANIATLAFKKLKVGKKSNLDKIKPLYVRRAEAEVQWQKKKKKSPLTG